ncbi:hypothetical protein F5Y10DRAFT_263007 [Nemania abortiva]|nr:hypothetical protein F5Y10DRAFT_263007 [Nemania abortiva]
MAKPFRKAIAKAFFGLTICDAEPSSRVRSQRPKKSDNTEAPIKTKRKSLLLDLPVEIRLEIYDLLLVNRFHRLDNLNWLTGNTRPKLIPLDVRLHLQKRTIDSVVLQTCKQIYHEAVPILYSRNIFHFHNPNLMLELMEEIRYMNIGLIRSLNIYVPQIADQHLWLTLFYALSQTAVDLKSVVVRWGKGSGTSYQNLGKDIALAQALARLSRLGVEKLRIEGYYAKPWPAYFRDKFGARVVEDEDGCPYPPRDNNDDRKRKLNEDTLEGFRKYQNGTDSLNPWEGVGHVVSPRSYTVLEERHCRCI